jgi:hypothetical protein
MDNNEDENKYKQNHTILKWHAVEVLSPLPYVVK